MRRCPVVAVIRLYLGLNTDGLLKDKSLTPLSQVLYPCPSHCFFYYLHQGEVMFLLTFSIGLFNRVTQKVPDGF